MPHFQIYDLIRWLHVACFAIGGGAAVAALMISGLEDDREDLRGLSAALWKLLVAWSFRIAVLLGAVLLAMRIARGDRPFDQFYLVLKLVFVILLLAVSELSPKSLARAKRGAPLLAVLLFLLASFVAINARAFGHRIRSLAAPAKVSAGPAS